MGAVEPLWETAVETAGDSGRWLDAELKEERVERRLIQEERGRNPRLLLAASASLWSVMASCSSLMRDRGVFSVDILRVRREYLRPSVLCLERREDGLERLLGVMGSGELERISGVSVGRGGMGASNGP